jgi:hypothetical protein
VAKLGALGPQSDETHHILFRLRVFQDVTHNITRLLCPYRQFCAKYFPNVLDEQGHNGQA